MHKRQLLALSLTALLVGCDALDEYRVNQAFEDYRLSCFGSGTNECQAMLVDTNVMWLELVLDKLEDRKDEVIEKAGEERYEAGIKMIKDEIERQKGFRPGFFARTFLSEARSVDAGKITLLSSAYAIDLKSALDRRFEWKIESPNGQDASQNDDDGKERIDTALAKYITYDQAGTGGTEYAEARRALYQDFTGDGIPDAIVLFTTEGAGGGNGYFQTLAFFKGAPEGLTFVSAHYPRGQVTELRLVDGRERLLELVTLDHGPDDADCCPSVKSVRQVVLGEDNAFVEKDLE